MTVQCCLCKMVRIDDHWSVTPHKYCPDGEIVSHTYCPVCAAAMRAKLREERAATTATTRPIAASA